MIDILTLALTHGLMAIAVWRLLSRDDLDDESVAAPEQGAKRSKWRRPPPPQNEA